MFKIDCLVDDKKLHIVMRLLNGLAYNVQATPVTAQVQQGQVKSTLRDGSANLALYQSMRKEFGTNPFGSKNMDASLTKLGLSAQSRNYHVQQMKAHKQLKIMGRGQYKLLDQPKQVSK